MRGLNKENLRYHLKIPNIFILQDTFFSSGTILHEMEGD